jgi:deazaflavin-dependent oxidoreductase (nitroreductase family)
MPRPLRKLSRKLWHQFTQAHVHAYRLSKGRIGRRFRGSPVLLLDHVGRKSGRKTTSPLIYAEDGDDLVIIASYGGARKHPVWWLNLRERPATTVQVLGEKREVTAREAEGEERERLWRKAVDVYAPYEDYQKRTKRRIPVIVLSRTTQPAKYG